MPVVEASSLVKTHGAGRGARRVLDGASLAIEAGEVVAVVGRSGSGKSTLTHLLGALDRPDAGTITIAGRRIDTAVERELVAIRRDLVGLVFQFFHLVPELTGEENVMLPARLPGANGAVERSRELIERLQLPTPQRAVRTSCPAESSSGSRSRAPSCATRRSSSPTSRRATSTQPARRPCSRCCAARPTTVAPS